MYNLRLLEFAVTLELHRNFGRAAQALRVTQPTLSRGIATLESNLGVRLFDRTNRRVTPTPAGAVLLARARSLLADAARLGADLGNHQNLRSGRISIGVGPYPLELSVIECVARLSARFPGLEFEVLEGQWRDFAPKLLSGEVEIAVMEASVVTAHPRFQVDMLPPRAGCFYCRMGHPLTARKPVTLLDILGFPLVGVRMPMRVLAVAKLDPSRVTLDPVTGDLLPHITTTSVATSRAIVMRTNGIGIAAPVQIADDVRLGKLAILAADASSLRSNYGITSVRGRTLSPGAQMFAETLKRVEAELDSDSLEPVNAKVKASRRNLRRA